MTGRLLSMFTVLAVAVAIAACGGDGGAAAGGGHGQGHSAGGDADARDRAFLAGMAHHHGSAIEMAEIAEQRAESPFVRRLAADILRTQREEIARMGEIHQRRFGAALTPDPKAHDGLGLSAAEAGMEHGEEDNAALRRAQPFDREFVDQMAPHHAGAVKMAEAVLGSTKDPEIRTLAEAIVATQRREIAAMNGFREERFGGPVPSGGGGHGGGHSG